MFIRLDKTPECDGMTDGRNPVASTAVGIASNADVHCEQCRRALRAMQTHCNTNSTCLAP